MRREFPVAGASVLSGLRGEGRFDRSSKKLGRVRQEYRVSWGRAVSTYSPCRWTLNNRGRYRSQEEEFAGLRSCTWSERLPKGQPAKATPSSALSWARPGIVGHVDAGMAWRIEDNEPGQCSVCARQEYWRPRHTEVRQVGVLVMDGNFLTFPSVESSWTDPVAPGPLVIL